MTRSVPSRRSHLAHLVRRFFGYLTARRLSPAEQMEVAVALYNEEATLFWGQHPSDQRHAIEVARRVADLLERAPSVERARTVRAALLHDVGKRHSRLGAIGRSVATVWDALGLPLPGEFRRYRDHGNAGANDLEQVGSDSLVVSFARLHPGPAPDPELDRIWQVLLDADHT